MNHFTDKPTDTGYAPATGRGVVAFSEMTDLALDRVGGKVLFSNDDFFATKDGLLKEGSALFVADKFTEYGKWMDGWESRRKRGLVPGMHDYCIIKLGIPGRIFGFNVDTAFFTGNHPEYAAIDIIESIDNGSDDNIEKLKNASWRPAVPKTKLQGGSQNFIPVFENTGRVTHIRLKIFPDGGVARLRVHGVAMPNFLKLPENFDLACIQNGGVVVASNDSYFGNKENIIFPDRGKTMADGWETKRKRGPGHDWLIIKLGASGKIKNIMIDTAHFKGNFPDSFSIEGLRNPARDLLSCDFRDNDMKWMELLGKTKLKANSEHEFKTQSEVVDYVRINIFPDGGISRVRLVGNQVP